jgi:cellobiose-specific phosphotransferase system component IIC
MLKGLNIKIATIIFAIFSIFIITPQIVSAAPQCGSGQVYNKSLKLCETKVTSGNLPKVDANQSTIKNILSIVIGILGAITLLMVVLSGFRYVLSNGEPEKIAKAKNALIYALIGLIIALSAQAIVSFIVKGI